MLATMRDTSESYRTYWIRDDLYYGKAKNLGEAACALPADKLAQIPKDDRELLIDEVSGNPSFCAKVAKVMNTRPDWGKIISSSAKEAIINEFDPSKFRERKGMWPKLRVRARDMAEYTTKIVRSRVASMTLQQKVEALKRIHSERRERPERLSGLGDLGFFDLLASVIGAAGNVYTADLIADTNKDIAKIQASTAINTITAQQSIAQAQAAIAAAQAQQAAIQSPIGSAIATFTQSKVAGIPVPVVLAAGGFAIWYVLKGR